MKETSPSRGCGGSRKRQRVLRWDVEITSKSRKGEFMSVITVGIDLAKNVFAVHGVDDSRSSERRNQWRRLNRRDGERPGLSGRFGEKTRAAADGRQDSVTTGSY